MKHPLVVHSLIDSPCRELSKEKEQEAYNSNAYHSMKMVFNWYGLPNTSYRTLENITGIEKDKEINMMVGKLDRSSYWYSPSASYTSSNLYHHFYHH